MSELSSSRDLHPSSGGRFVFEQLDATPRYRVTVHLPAGRSVEAELAWVEGQAELRPAIAPATPTDPELAWAQTEALKLARVLHRDPKPRLVRWRG